MRAYGLAVMNMNFIFIAANHSVRQGCFEWIVLCYGKNIGVHAQWRFKMGCHGGFPKLKSLCSFCPSHRLRKETGQEAVSKAKPSVVTLTLTASIYYIYRYYMVVLNLREAPLVVWYVAQSEISIDPQLPTPLATSHFPFDDCRFGGVR